MKTVFVSFRTDSPEPARVIKNLVRDGIAKLPYVKSQLIACRVECDVPQLKGKQ